MASPFFYSLPPMYPITYVNQTYPEHHYPLEATRHRLSHAFHDMVIGERNDIRNPRTDIRETSGKYYIDVELPGITTAKDVSIKWSNSRLLVIKGKIDRNPTVEETAAKEATGDIKELHPKDHPVHFLARERHTGTFMRAFEFATDVDHDSLIAKLLGGLLEITVEKKAHGHLKDKEVKIEHAEESTTKP